MFSLCPLKKLHHKYDLFNENTELYSSFQKNFADFIILLIFTHCMFQSFCNFLRGQV
jgi:hypothetical protein